MRCRKHKPLVVKADRRGNQNREQRDIHDPDSAHTVLPQPLFRTGAGINAPIVRFARIVFIKSPFFGASVIACVGAICALRTMTNFGALRISARKPKIWDGVASSANVIVISLKALSLFLAGETVLWLRSNPTFFAASSTIVCNSTEASVGLSARMKR